MEPVRERGAGRRRRGLVWVAGLAAVAGLVGGCGLTSASGAQTEPDAVSRWRPDVLDGADLQDALDDLAAEQGDPAAIVGVWSSSGEWVVTSPAGRTLTERTSVRADAVLATMTATVLLQLVSDGAAPLDDPVERWVEGVPGGSSITLRQLAGQTSGLPSYADQPAFVADPGRRWTAAERLDLVRAVPPTFAPDQGWAYSETNDLVLALAVERIAGQPLARVLEDRLFAPAGLRDTWLTPDGGLVSTLWDLRLWAAAFAQPDGLLPERAQQVRRSSVVRFIAPERSLDTGYGLGLSVHDGWWGTDGRAAGATATVEFDPELGMTFVVVTTAASSSSAATPTGATGPEASPAAAVADALRPVLRGG